MLKQFINEDDSDSENSTTYLNMASGKENPRRNLSPLTERALQNKSNRPSQNFIDGLKRPRPGEVLPDPFQQKSFISSRVPMARKSTSLASRKRLTFDQLKHLAHGANFMSLMTLAEFFNSGVYFCSRAKMNTIGSIICSLRDWLKLCDGDPFPVEEKCAQLQYDSCLRLLSWLQKPLPIFLLSIRSEKSAYHLLSADDPKKMLQQVEIAREKDQIQNEKLENLQFRIEILAKANVGFETMKSAGELQREPEESDLPSEKRLEEVQEQLLDNIGIVVHHLIKGGQLSSKCKPIIRKVLRGEPIEDLMDQLDNHTISVLVNKLQLLSFVKQGRRLRLVLNDFGS